MANDIPDPVFDAFVAAQKRGALPTALDTAGLREMSAAVRYSAAFTARGTSAIFAQEIKDVIDAITDDQIGEAEGIARLAEKLRFLGYTPEGGFAGDEGVVPEAIPGTLQDLSSYRRLQLIIRTQVDMMTGRGEQMRGQTPEMLEAYPAWELVRVMSVEVPRDWPSRWVLAGGRPLEGNHAAGTTQALYAGTGMIALKGDPVWGELGSSGNFADALDVDHPPFCFNSGMGWQEVSRERCQRLGITGPDGETVDEWLASQPITMAGAQPLPAPTLSMRDVDPNLVRAFAQETGAVPVDGKPTQMTVPKTPDGEIDFSDLLAKAAARRAAARAARNGGGA